MAFTKEEGFPFAPSEQTLEVFNKLRKFAGGNDGLVQVAIIACRQEDGRADLRQVIDFILATRREKLALLEAEADSELKRETKDIDSVLEQRIKALDDKQKEYFHNIEGYDYDVKL